VWQILLSQPEELKAKVRDDPYDENVWKDAILLVSCKDCQRKERG